MWGFLVFFWEVSSLSELPEQTYLLPCAPSFSIRTSRVGGKSSAVRSSANSASPLVVASCVWAETDGERKLKYVRICLCELSGVPKDAMMANKCGQFARTRPTAIRTRQHISISSYCMKGRIGYPTFSTLFSLLHLFRKGQERLSQSIGISFECGDCVVFFLLGNDTRVAGGRGV